LHLLVVGSSVLLYLIDDARSKKSMIILLGNYILKKLKLIVGSMYYKVVET